MLRFKTKGFTLIEWLIVIAIISILLIIVFAHVNPLRERDRATDSRRKADLDRISIALEEFYSDHDCYPSQETFNLREGLRPYLSQTPRDPDTNEPYAYIPEDSSCPQYYRVYANLRWQDDSAINEVGCEGGCGPDGIYNYGTASPGVGLVTGETTTGCSGSGCYYCQEDLDSTCACNRSGEDQCGGTIPAEYCFDDSSCGGYNGQMPPSEDYFFN
ncbi:MAG: type II secretion system protein [Patescibacteria group bacterium]|jgi:prepilin-type N-terminal cleavage/methylation domain-containing protein